MSILSIVDKIDSLNRSNRLNQDRPVSGHIQDKKPVSQEPDMEEIHNYVDMLNSSADKLNERISFSYNKKTHRIVMKVIDSETEEVIREIPPKAMMKLLEHIQEHLGMLVDESR